MKSNDAFYFAVFKHLEKIGEDANRGYPDSALRKLLFLVATLPPDIKEKVRPSLDQAKTCWENHGNRIRPPRESVEEDTPHIIALSQCYNWGLIIVDQISTFLHEFRST
jgi:hypothetical protein